MNSSQNSDRRLIAIEGLPGSGHSELARWIGDQPGWYAACAQEQPTLTGGRTSLLPPLLQILLDRYEWAQGLIGTDMFREHVITDFLFQTHVIWAHTLLSEKDWLLYQKVAAVIVPPAIHPDLVVYLQAPDEDVLECLRPMEKSVAPELWREMISSFNHFFFSYDATPLLVVRTAAAQWLGSESAKAALLGRILSVRGAKTYLMGEADVWAGGQPAAD